jgi:hypothetical protein
MMASRVQEAELELKPYKVLTPAELVEQFPSEHHQRIENDILRPVMHMLAQPDSEELKLEGRRAIRQMESFGYEIVIENGTLVGAKTRRK